MPFQFSSGHVYIDDAAILRTQWWPTTVHGNHTNVLARFNIEIDKKTPCYSATYEHTLSLLSPFCITCNRDLQVCMPCNYHLEKDVCRCKCREICSGETSCWWWEEYCNKNEIDNKVTNWSKMYFCNLIYIESCYQSVVFFKHVHYLGSNCFIGTFRNNALPSKVLRRYIMRLSFRSNPFPLTINTYTLWKMFKMYNQ